MNIIKAVNILRWITRVLAVMFALFIAMMAIGQGGPPNPFRFEGKVAVELVAMYVMWTGLLAGLKREIIGGSLLFGGFAVFMIAEGRIINGLGFSPFVLIGLLYIAVGIAGRHIVEQEETE